MSRRTRKSATPRQDTTPRRRAGRKSKLTPEIHDKIIQAIRAGNYLEVAAANAGVSVAAIYRWFDFADDPARPDVEVFREFREAVERARAEAEVRTVALVSKAVQGGYVTKRTTRSYKDAATGRVVSEVAEDVAPIDGRLGLDYLSRVHPKRWGRVNRDRLEVTGADGGPVQVEAGSAAALAGRLAQIVAARREELEMVPEDTARGIEVTVSDLPSGESE